MVDAIKQMCRTDVQMSDGCVEQISDVLKCKSLQVAVNSRSKSLVIRPISSQWRVEDKVKHVVLVVQMVRALAQTARGVGSSPTKCYSFLCTLLWVV